jgi:hypothetical protein
MTKTLNRFALSTTALLTLSMHGAWAKVPTAEAERLGKDLTCMGAEKAANKDGSIPEYSGKWQGTPPGVDFKGPGHPYPDPYASEKPLYTVTAQNMAQYADKLSEGQKAMLQKYAQAYRIPVYQSHRDFRMPDWVCASSKENALKAELVDGNNGVKGVRGAAPFPVPKSGDELLLNLTYPFRVSQESATYDQAVVYPNGNIAWGRNYYRILNPAADPASQPRTTDGVSALANVKTLLPERNKGEVIVSTDTYNFKAVPRNAYQYNPGTRRVRQMPEFGFDMPFGPGGFRTIDDDRLFNGSPERYDWKLIGKREMLIPYDGYRLDDPQIKYADLLKTNTINPDYMRYELHRVWVVEATLKEGFRHQYAKRVIYLDEDTWQPVMADSYDARGQLWRVGLVSMHYLYDAGAFGARVTLYHDLSSGAYMADRMINEVEQQPLYNEAAKLKSDMFTPEFARSEGR